MEQELNKYLTPNLSEIVISYTKSPYRLVCKIRDKIIIVDLETGDHDYVATIPVGDIKILDTFVLYHDLLYYIVNKESRYRSKWSLRCYDIIKRTTTYTLTMKNRYSPTAMYLVGDVLVIIHQDQSFGLNLITKSMVRPINKVDDYIILAKKAGLKEWIDTNNIKISQTPQQVTINNRWMVDGLFNKHSTWFVVKVYNELLYVLDDSDDYNIKISVYNYKTNTLVNELNNVLKFDYYTFNDLSVSRSLY